MVIVPKDKFEFFKNKMVGLSEYVYFLNYIRIFRAKSVVFNKLISKDIYERNINCLYGKCLRLFLSIFELNKLTNLHI